MKTCVINMFNLNIRHLKRLMIVFVFLSCTVSAFSENWTAKVKSGATNNSTGSGSIYINGSPTNEAKEENINESTTKNFKLEAVPLFHSKFEGWYDQDGKSQKSTKNPCNLTLDKDNQEAKYYAYFTTEKFDGVKLYKNYDNKWLRIMLNNKQDITDKTYTFQLNYPCNNISYEAWLSGSANISHTISVDATGESKNLADQDWQNGNRYKSTQSIKTDIKQIIFTGNQGATGNKTIYVDNIYAEIAPHIILNTSNEQNLGAVEIDGTKTLDVDFKSFLTSGNLVVETNNPNFLLNGDKEKITLCEGNTLEKINEDTKNFQIVYSAKENKVGEEDNATITIKDEGNNNSCTINIKAICVKKTPTINWNNISTQIPVDESVSLDNVTSTSTGKITFTSSDATIIKVENNLLMALKEGTVKITAKIEGTNRYKEYEESLDFEATQKIIQNIVWNQQFYSLKIGDQNITLNAKATDKKTGLENGNLIEYSSANTDIVTVDDGVLKIVGKGQTTITAHQRGNDEYVGTYITKPVFVREVSTECTDPIIAELTEEPTSKSGGFNWETISYTTKEWNNIPKEVTFTIKCSDIATEYLTDLGGAKLTIKDQNGNNIYGPTKGNNQSKTHTIPLDRSVRKLTFELTCNLDRSISNIIVHPDIYLETETKSINYAGAEIDKPNEQDVIFDWANQPDMMWATIEDDKDNVFSVDKKTYIFGEGCGKYGRSTIKTIFHPKKEGDNYSANLVIYRGEGENTKKMKTIPITATAIKISQTITWNQDLTALNPTQGNNYDLTATASSGLNVTYISSDENVARIEDNKLFVVGAGNATITATQSGNYQYKAAASIEQSISVAKRDQTITWNQDLANLTVGKTYTLEATASSGLNVTYTSSNTNVARIEGNQLVVVDVGSATITANQNGNENFEAATPIKKVIGAKLSQTITWNQDLTNLTQGNTYTLNATATSGLTVTYTSSDENVARIEGGKLVVVGAGTATITANQNGNENFNAATPINKEITIRNITIIESELPSKYYETETYGSITRTITRSHTDLADWLWISSPFNATVSVKFGEIDIPLTWKGNSAPDACYLLKKYDAEARATGTVKPWVDVQTSAGNPTIYAGKGYILGVDPRSYEGDFTITFTSVNSTNASNNNGYTTTNPNYPSEYPTLDNNHVVGTGLFETPSGLDFSTNEYSSVFFAVRADANSSTYYNYYDNNFSVLEPYKSFFMQYGGEYTFKTSVARQNAPAAANGNTIERYQLNINSDNYNDKTVIFMAEDGTEGYTVGQDFFYMTKTADGGTIGYQFYTLDGKEPLSYNHRKNENQVIKLGGRVKKAGEYTISLEGKNIKAQSVVLVDSLTGETVDLLVNNYTFTAGKGTIDQRFVLTFNFAPQTTVDIFTPSANQIVVFGNTQNCTINNLIIGETVMIFDAMGRMIYNKTANSKTINITLPTGTYIVRNANNWAKFAIR